MADEKSQLGNASNLSIEMTLRVYRRFMTERWPTTTDIESMIHWAKDPPLDLSERKLRLFAVACCRRVWKLLPDAAVKRLVEVCEQFADELVTAKEMQKTRQQVSPSGSFRRRTPRTLAREAVLWAVGDREVHFTSIKSSLAIYAAAHAAKAGGLATPGGEEAERQVQAALLRDIVGDPLRPIRADPAWLSWHGGVVAGLARAAYQERRLPQGTLDANRLRILADALAEAGCENAEMLGHLRGPGPHVRGCHVVDILLDREAIRGRA